MADNDPFSFGSLTGLEPVQRPPKVLRNRSRNSRMAGQTSQSGVANAADKISAGIAGASQGGNAGLGQLKAAITPPAAGGGSLVGALDSPGEKGPIGPAGIRTGSSLTNALRDSIKGSIIPEGTDEAARRTIRLEALKKVDAKWDEKRKQGLADEFASNMAMGDLYETQQRLAAEPKQMQADVRRVESTIKQMSDEQKRSIDWASEAEEARRSGHPHIAKMFDQYAKSKDAGIGDFDPAREEARQLRSQISTANAVYAQIYRIPDIQKRQKAMEEYTKTLPPDVAENTPFLKFYNELQKNNIMGLNVPAAKKVKISSINTSLNTMAMSNASDAIRGRNYTALRLGRNQYEQDARAKLDDIGIPKAQQDKYLRKSWADMLVREVPAADLPQAVLESGIGRKDFEEASVDYMKQIQKSEKQLEINRKREVKARLKSRLREWRKEVKDKESYSQGKETKALKEIRSRKPTYKGVSSEYETEQRELLSPGEKTPQQYIQMMKSRFQPPKREPIMANRPPSPSEIVYGQRYSVPDPENKGSRVVVIYNPKTNMWDEAK